ncbi:MAG: hypothetical protein EBR67_05610, partial [Proteobacteria bacterium]|nr:hypothetical protein [Pseudomonadota bacterium]
MNLNLVTTDNMPKSDIKNQVTNSTLLEQENSHTPITDENHEDKENAENDITHQSLASNLHAPQQPLNPVLQFYENNSESLNKLAM